MNEYDEFEAEMIEAGWSLDEIEAMWQKHKVNPSHDDNPDYTVATASSVWAKDSIGRTTNMKSLNKEQLSNLSQLQSDLQDAQDKVESAIADFNANVNELWSNLVLESLDNYNNLVRQAQNFVEETQDEMQVYYDERSEKWQESDRGSCFQGWLDEWDSTELEEIELTMPEETDVPEFQALEAITELPTQLSQ